MAEFSVHGPFDVPITTLPSGGHFIDEASLDELAEESAEFERIGVYVFGLRTGGGTLPIYVGMTQSRKLIKEAFDKDKLNKINQYINTHTHGTLVVYLVTQIRGPGQPNKSDVENIEFYLIGLARGRKPDLINIHGNSAQTWGIRGVVHGGPGQPSKEALAFKDMMGA